MAEIEITLPTVQYGNVRVRATPEELGWVLADASQVGVAAAVYLNLFTQGFKVGAAIDVGAPSRPSEAPLAASQSDPVDRAQQLLDEGLGGVTELSETAPPEGAASPTPVTELPGEEPGETWATTDHAPWKQPAVDAPVKPWETGVTAPAVLDAAW